MFRTLRSIRSDLQVVFERDPAATSVVEVVLAYPGLHAIWLHRLAHRLHGAGVPVLPRLISHFNRFVTGIEIHPQAQIGNGFFIDHGMGVVIGQTAEIGENCTIYQGVTLGIYHAQGARSLRGTKRHPTLRDNVIVGVGAKILGAITVGEGAIVAPGAVVTRDVPPHSTVMGIPARVVTVRDPETGEKRRVDATARVADLPDPLLELIRCMQEQIATLEGRLQELESGSVPQRPAPAPAVPALQAAPRTTGHSGRHVPRRPCGDQLERAIRTSVGDGREARPAES